MKGNQLLIITVIALFIQFLIQNAEARQVVQGASAHWISESQLIWDAPSEANAYKIVFSNSASDLDWSSDSNNTLTLTKSGIWNADISAIHKHLAGRTLFDVEQDRVVAEKGIKGAVTAVAYDDQQNIISSTRVQFAGLLDDLFFYNGDLGIIYKSNSVSLKVWAPTAKNVNLLLFDDHKKQTDKITGRYSEGIWSFDGPLNWDRRFYLYEVEVYHYLTGHTETFRVTDPYSVSLSTDSEFSQLVNLQKDNTLKPAGWDSLKKELPRHVDISVYETHMRDFSVYDFTVPKRYRGTYRAFTLNGSDGRVLSDGMRHLQTLADAGLTHLHLLPVNDIGSVPEKSAEQIDLSDPWERICDFVNLDLMSDGCENHGTESIWSVFERESEINPVTKSIQSPYSDPGIYEGVGEYDPSTGVMIRFILMHPRGVTPPTRKGLSVFSNFGRW